MQPPTNRESRRLPPLPRPPPQDADEPSAPFHQSPEHAVERVARGQLETLTDSTAQREWPDRGFIHGNQHGVAKTLIPFNSLEGKCFPDVGGSVDHSNSAPLSHQTSYLQQLSRYAGLHPFAIADDVFAPGGQLKPVMKLHQLLIAGLAHVPQAKHLGNRRAAEAHFAGDSSLCYALRSDESQDPFYDVLTLIRLSPLTFVQHPCRPGEPGAQRPPVGNRSE